MRPVLLAHVSLLSAALAAPAPAQSAPAGKGLTASIDAGRAVFVAGLPCPIELELSNGGSKPVKLDWSIAMGEGLHVRGVDLAPGAQEKQVAPTLHVDMAAKPFELPPNVAVTITIDLNAVNNGAYAALCGVYDAAEVWFEADGVKSAPARVDLVEDLSKTLVVLDTTKGVMKLSLDPKHAPLACRNFVRHVQLGTYNGTLFHRVIKDFMAQGGDPNSRDAGNPASWGGGGAPFNGKRFHAEMDPTVKFERGTLAMARNGDPLGPYGQMPLQQLLQAAQQGNQVAAAMQQRIAMMLKIEGVNVNDMKAVEARYQELQRSGFFREPQVFLDSSGSQFFICFSRKEHLDGNYIAFGKLVAGDDVLSKIEALAAVDPNSGKPSEEIKITKASIEKLP